MVNVGDRVIVEGNKVGQQRREGVCVGQVGSLLRVRWDDETESLFTPGAGAVRFLPGRSARAATASVTKKKSAPAKKAAPKKGVKKR
jgi:hypothetical protein